MIKRSDNKPICTTNKYWGHICLYPNLHPINIIYIISKITYQEEMSHLGAQVCRCSSIRQPGKLFLKKRIASIKAWRYETRCWAKGTMCNSVVVVQGQLWRGWSCEVEKRATEHSSLSQVHCYGKSVCAWLCLTLCSPMDCSPPGSMGFSRQGYWSGVPSPSLVLASTVQQTESAVCISSPRGSPVLGIEPTSLASPAREMQLVGAFFTTAPCRKIGIHISPLFLNFLPI